MGTRKEHKLAEASTYCVDILDFLCRFKFVIGFCAFVEEAVSMTIQEKMQAMHVAGGSPPRRIYMFNLGNLKGDGREVINPPQFVLRSGTSKLEMRKQTLG